MESYTLELNPNRPIHYGLFTNVQNASELYDKFKTYDETLGLCLIEASMVFNKFHLLLAVNRAIHDEQTTKLKTANINAEIVYGFALNTNIAKTFVRFGINKNTKDMIVVRVGSESTQDAETYIKEHVKGDLVEFNVLPTIRNVEEIKKTYGVDAQVTEEDEIMALVTGAIALKGH